MSFEINLRENKMNCEHENIEPSTVDGEIRCTECGESVRR